MQHRIPGIEVPSPAARVWRYMIVAKFEMLCKKSSLWFSRADKFEDEWEGVVPPQAALDHHHVAKWINDQRHRTFVNCWHVNEYESTAMWSAYTGSTPGLVIESTFERLASVFESHKPIIYLGLVKYIDFEIDTLSTWKNNVNIYHPIMYKRKYFESEHELRAMINPMSNESRAASARGDVGMSVPVDLQKLIVGIRIAKGTHTLMEEVQQIATNIGVAAPITASEINRPPPLS